MGHYVHYIGGGIVDSKIYETGNAAKSFKSPMKELNEQTVLIENAKQIRMIVIISIRNTMIR